ncbi:DUF3515 family protein [Streptomyces sp. NPDC048182]|uniref:DUF3515 family protein n=1 Tax=unclassified Streptomyces TaxID=2593676 RepID=UPI0033BA6834
MPSALRRRLTPRVWIALIATLTVLVGGLLYVDSHRVPAAPHAGDPACDKVVSRLPDDIPGAKGDWTLGEGTASWGGQAAVFRCGVTEPQPTTDLCVDVDGVDWVLDEARLKRDGVSVLRTYGRSPAAEFTYKGKREDVGGILSTLDPAVAWLPKDRKCVGVADVL